MLKNAWKHLFCAVILVFCSTLYAQTTTQNPPSAAQAPAASEDVKKILADRVDLYKKSVGIVVGTIGPQGSRIYSYGKLASDSSAAPDGDTLYEIGSATKVFTSLLLADMVKQGEVRLDDPVAKYLPASVKVPERNGRKITLVDLATHTSGLPRLPNNLKPKDLTNPYADYTVEQMYAFLSGYELTRDIGSKYEYSNLGVGLLGHMLALRAGSDYETLVKTRILIPLKMTSTTITLTAPQRARLAHGHNDALYPVANWDLPTLAGAGALRSTAADLLKFLSANIGLSESGLAAAMKSMLEIRKSTGIPDMEIALAWHVLKRDGDEIIWHNGGTGGYHSFMGFNPRTRTGVVVLSNASIDIDDIGRHLLDSRFELAKLSVPKEHKEIALDGKLFEPYVGHYELAPNIVLTVTREDNKFFAQLGKQPQFQIFPESETDFFYKVVDAQLTFVKEPDGKVSRVVLHQGGRDQPLRRID